MEADWRNEKHDIKRAVRTGRYKLYYDRYTKHEELYDLITDPGEKRNILETHPEIAEDLRGKLKEWMATERGDPARIELTGNPSVQQAQEGLTGDFIAISTDDGEVSRVVSLGNAGATYSSMPMKWQTLPPRTNRCQTAWW